MKEGKIIVIILMVITYLGVSFASKSFNPMGWGDTDCLTWMIMNLLYIVVYAFLVNEK